MKQPVDRTFRTNPVTFSAALNQQITEQAAYRYAKWTAEGRLPLVIRLKNRFSCVNVTLDPPR